MTALWPVRHWQAFWRRAPRQLRVLGKGKVVLWLAGLTGFAAMNTGNNLLFICWGLVLGAIVLSGILSERSLAPLRLTAHPPPLGRVGEGVRLELLIKNTAKSGSVYALNLDAEVYSARNGDKDFNDLAEAAASQTARARFILSLAQGRSRSFGATFVPSQRGLARVASCSAVTSFPFGFFAKRRRFSSPQKPRFWVAPAAVSVPGMQGLPGVRQGALAASVPGQGEDFFSLRGHRDGEDLRLVHWPSSVKRQQLVLRETAAQASRRAVVRYCLPADAPLDIEERGLSVLGSVVEYLLGYGFAVSVCAPGTLVPHGAGERQRHDCLLALAKVDLNLKTPDWPARDSGSLHVAVAIEVSRNDADHTFTVGASK